LKEDVGYRGPANIFISRHAEKNSDSSKATYYTINSNGIQRSVELPDLINQLANNGYPIFAIVTCNPEMDLTESFGDISMRPQQTAFMSAWLLNIPVYIFSGSNVTQPYDATTAISIYTNPIFQGKNILIFWEHENIQGLSNQIVQCNEYINHNRSLTPSHAVTNLQTDHKGLNILYHISTKKWWMENTIVDDDQQYAGDSTPTEVFDKKGFYGYVEGLLNGQCAYRYNIPYSSYSQYLPFWNSKTFNKMYWFYQEKNKENNLRMKYFIEDIKTPYKSCDLTIGAIQYAICNSGKGWTQDYTDSGKCIPPNDKKSKNKK